MAQAQTPAAATAATTATTTAQAQAPAAAAAATTMAQAPEGPMLGAGTMALSFSLPTSGVPTVGFQYFIVPNGALDVALGLGFIFNRPGGGTTADVSAGIGYRAYLGRTGNLVPFVEPMVGFSRMEATTPLGNALVNVMVAGGFGVEYFFTNQFTIGGEIALGLNVATTGGGSVANQAFVTLNTNTSNLFASFKW
jgi:hypothetical protein